MRGALTSRWIPRKEDEVEVALGDAEAAAAEVEVPMTLSEMSGAEERRQAAKTGRRSSSATTHYSYLGGESRRVMDRAFQNRAEAAALALAEKWLQPFWIAHSALSISIGYEKSDD